MLRFANIVLSNPAKPELPAILLKAVVTDGDFGLAIGPHIADKLELKKIDLREVKEIGKKSAILVPYVGPVRVTCGGKEAFAGAINCVNGVVIGAQLAKELHLDIDVQMGSGFGEGLVAFGMSEKPESKDELIKKILIKESVIDVGTCKRIVDFAKEQKRKQTGVEVVKNSIMPGAEAFKKSEHHARDAFSIRTDSLEPLLRSVFYTVMHEHVSPFIGRSIESWERPQLLSYERGGKYDPHADGELSVGKPGGKRVWQRLHNRDVSILLYLNTEFTGGDLTFPDFDITITPKPGLLVAFPSTADYLHGAQPTLSGDRMVLVTWAAIEGTPRMMGEGKNDVLMSSFKEHKQ
jgi:hypothetical protein